MGPTADGSRSRTRLFLSAAFLAFAAAAVLAPILIWGPTHGNDIAVHLRWAEAFAHELRDGCHYPRWLSAANNGFGNPTFIFYFPGFFYAVAGLKALGLSAMAAIVGVSGIALWASGVFMALFLYPSCGWPAALMASVFYMAAPFRLLDIYERSALPESAALLWPPLVMMAVERAGSGRGRWWLLVAGLGMAGLTFTHHGILALFLPLLLAHATLVGWRGRSYWPLAALFAGVGVGAISLWPAIAERTYVHWMPPIFRSGLLYSDLPTFFPAFRHQVGRDAIFYAFAAALAAAHAIRTRDLETTMFAFAAVFSFFLTTIWSLPLWQALPPLQMIDLPWRWLAVTTFSVAVVAGRAAARAGTRRLATATVLVIGIALGCRNWVARARYAPVLLKPQAITAPWIELVPFRPRWSSPFQLPSPRGPTLTGGRVELVRRRCEDLTYRVFAPRAANLEVDVLYYPSWTATADGHPLPVRANQLTGRIVLRVPQGTREVELRFGDTPDRQAARWISLGALCALAGIAVGSGRRQIT